MKYSEMTDDEIMIALTRKEKEQATLENHQMAIKILNTLGLQSGMTRCKLGEFREGFNMLILSQASNEEGATTILYGVHSSEWKRPTTRTVDDIV